MGFPAPAPADVHVTVWSSPDAIVVATGPVIVSMVAGNVVAFRSNVQGAPGVGGATGRWKLNGVALDTVTVASGATDSGQVVPAATHYVNVGDTLAYEVTAINGAVGPYVAQIQIG
jgi:hypothetical protein